METMGGMTANCTQEGEQQVTATLDSIALLSTKQQIQCVSLLNCAQQAPTHSSAAFFLLLQWTLYSQVLSEWSWVFLVFNNPNCLWIIQLGTSQ